MITRRAHSVVATLAAAAFAAACAPSDTADDAWSGEIADSAGVRVVSNPLRGAWTEGERWQVEELIRIGSATGDPDYQFGHIVGVTQGETGSFFVLDQQAAQIRAFSATGQFEYGIGALGSGPGEISEGGAGALLNGPADTLLVADLGAQRVVRFLENGQSAGGFRTDWVEVGIPLHWVADGAGSVAVQLHTFPRPGAPVSRDVVVSVGGQGELVDTLLSFPPSRAFGMRDDGQPFAVYFAAEPVWTLASQQSVLYGFSDQYRIERHTSEGGVTEVFSKSWSPVPVAPEDQQIMIAAYTDLMRRDGATLGAIQRFRSNANFARTFPAIVAMHAGPKGTIWVQPFATPSALGAERYDPLLPSGGSDWDVFGAEGRYLGAVSMPDGFTAFEFAADRVFGVWRDELDVQHVMVLRIVEPNAH